MQRRQRFRLVQRSEVGQLLERFDDLVVDQHRAREPFAAVDDPVDDRLGVIEAVAQRGLELVRIDLRARSLELTRGEDPLVAGDQAELSELEPALTARIATPRTVS